MPSSRPVLKLYGDCAAEGPMIASRHGNRTEERRDRIAGNLAQRFHCLINTPVAVKFQFIFGSVISAISSSLLPASWA